MLDYLDKLRAKPVHVRQRIAWIATVALSFLVGSVWWATWNTEDTTASPVLAKVSTPSPWSVVSNVFIGAKGEMTAALTDATNQLKHATEGNLNYVPPKEIGTIRSGSENFPNSIVVHDVVPSEVSVESTAGEVIHTRPKTLEQINK